MAIRLRTLAMLLAAAALAASAFVYWGVYEIAATEPHTRPVHHFLEFAMRRAVKMRAQAVTVPDLADPRRLDNGLRLYRGACAQCHGAPGIGPERFAAGMMPAPENLVEAARAWQPAEIYWVVRHGTKMTGMPAWQYRLSDDEIWDVVAFVMRLPLLSPQEYASWSGTVAAQQGGRAAPAALRPGNAEAGQRAITQYLCATCHRIPGIVGATRHVGPPLNGIATRRYIGGVVPNTPDAMVRWLQNPQQFDAQSAMPNLGISEQDARDIAAYLYTLDDLD